MRKENTFGKAGDKYVTGDWNADGKTEIGVVRNSNTWLLDASGNGAYGAGDLVFTFGKIGDINYGRIQVFLVIAKPMGQTIPRASVSDSSYHTGIFTGGKK